MLFDNDIQTVNVQAVVFKRSRFKLSLYKPGAGSRTWRERPAWKHGHWEHLDGTHESIDCASAIAEVFHSRALPKWAAPDAKRQNRMANPNLPRGFF
jgi:hypothetical protein